MNYQTVRLVSTFRSGSRVSKSPKVETAAVFSFGLIQKWKLRTRFQFWAYTPVIICGEKPKTVLFHIHRTFLNLKILSLF